MTAVDAVTPSVSQGELISLLGPNSAGKTTLVKMLCTLVLPGSGTATAAGTDLRNEPTLSLDPITTQHLHELILRARAERGMTSRSRETVRSCCTNA